MTILTPKGYRPARQPTGERPEVPAEDADATAREATPSAETAPPLETPPEVGPDMEGQQIKLAFPPQLVGINCPNCGTPYPVQVFSIVDVGQDPVLKSLLLSGQLNMAVCPRCGTGGAISSPLLYHDPEHSFLGIYVPEQVEISRQQEVIGQLSKRLMDGLPPEARRGYMLTPKQFLSYQSLLEAVLENEGITREMMDRQRRQLQLLEQALTALQDPEGLRKLATDRDADMDDEFFGLLQALTSSAAASGDRESMASLMELREQLIELTTWGQGVQKQRAAVSQLKANTTPSQLLDMVLAAENERVVDALITAGRPLADYGFFQELTQRAEAAKERGDEAEAQRLVGLRSHILAFTQQLDQLQQAILQESTQLLSEILAANDISQAVAERAALIDQNFLSVLAANLDQAERQGATAAVKRLQEVWDAAVAAVQEGAPPEFTLINRLLSAEYPGETRQLLSEHRDQVTDQLIETMGSLARQLEEQGDQELASRLRQIRSQAQLLR